MEVYCKILMQRMGEGEGQNQNNDNLKNKK